ncbi:MAG: hypothetical protein KC917_04995, partial [Candidatus Omnitrophica bacterium]|nr:hypothetical protein [Candidatus Omnitrophota bacterium]
SNVDRLWKEAIATSSRLIEGIRGLRSRGIRVTPRGLWPVSTAHAFEDIERTFDICRQSVENLNRQVLKP